MKLRLRRRNASMHNSHTTSATRTHKHLIHMYVCKKNRRHKHVCIASGAAIDGAPVAAAADANADAAVSSDIWFQFTFNFLIAFELLDMYGHVYICMCVCMHIA